MKSQKEAVVSGVHVYYEDGEYFPVSHVTLDLLSTLHKWVFYKVL